MSFHVPNEYRVRTGQGASSDECGNNGWFRPQLYRPLRKIALIIASDGEGWDHVSVSCHDRCPIWDEMIVIKSLFWDHEDSVVQFHPPVSEYVNCHPTCLHLWRPQGYSIVTPPSYLVGPK